MPKKQSRAGASPSSPTCGMEPVASPPSLFLVSRDRKPEPAQCPLLRVLWSLWVYRVSSKASRDTPGPAGLRGWKGRQNEKTRLNTLLPKPQRAHTQFFIFGFLQRKYFIDKGSHWRLSSRSLLTLMLSGDAVVLSPSVSERLPQGSQMQRASFPGEKEKQRQAGTALLPVCEPWWVAPGYSPGRKFSASGQHCLLHHHCPALHSVSTQGVRRISLQTAHPQPQHHVEEPF